MIRHLAANAPTTLIAAARFERNVGVWDVRTREQIGAFETVLDFGGHRLAIHPDGRQVVAGAYRRYGIACYEAESGRVTWQRKDIKRLQYVTYSADGCRVLCAVEGGPARALDANDGRDVGRWRGTTELLESRFQPWLLLHRKNIDVASFTGELVARIPRETFAVLDAVFGPGFIAMSESGGSVRCYELPSGRMLWRYTPPAGQHVLQLGMLPPSQRLVGVLWAYERGGSKQLILLDPKGVVERTTVLGEIPETAFVESLEALVLSDGRVLDVPSGAVSAVLPFADAFAQGA